MTTRAATPPGSRTSPAPRATARGLILFILVILFIALGAASCGGDKVPREVRLARAPHLLETGWQWPSADGVAVTMGSPRAVSLFVAREMAPLRIRLRALARPGGSEGGSVRTLLNGCDLGTWEFTREPDLVLAPPATCVREGVNLLEFESASAPGSAPLSLETVAVEQSAAPPGPPSVKSARIGQEIRRAMASPEASFEIPLRVEAPSDLETAVGLSGRGWNHFGGSVHVRLVLLDREGREQVLVDRTLGRGGEGAGKWEAVRADLSSRTGQDVLLRLTRQTIPQERGDTFPDYADPAMFVELAEPVLVPRTPPREGPPPIILVIFDALRADHLPVYGYGRQTSPNIEALARDGIVYRTCLAPSPWTLPSVASILTGLYPGQHLAGLRRPLGREAAATAEDEFIAPFRTFRSVTRASGQARTLPTSLREGGYLSAGFVENTFLSDRSGLASGFSRFLWVFDIGSRLRDVAERRRLYAGDEPARTWISEHAASRFFLLRHYLSPHIPYTAIPGDERFVRAQDAPELGDLFEDERGAFEGRYGPAARRRIEDLYDESIVLSDRRFGDLLASLKERGIYDRALILVTADHGEEFWDHGGQGHGHTLYGELLKVPLILKLPAGKHAGSVIEDPVRLIDLAPTILEAAGLAVPHDLPGRPLPLLSHGRADEFEALAEAALIGPQRRLARRGHLELILTERRPERLIFGGRAVASERSVELFDLASDPGEKRDLSSARPAEVAAMRRFLIEQFEKARRPPPPGGQGLALDEEEIEQLKSLGYVAGH